MEKEVNMKMLVDFVLGPEEPNEGVAQSDLNFRTQWKKLIGKALQNKFYFSSNYPVLFLGLFLWSGLFGGVWFAYRSMFWFGVLIWPLLTVTTTFLVVMFFGLLVQLGIFHAEWLLPLAITGYIIPQFILSTVANYIYLRMAIRKIKTKHNFKQPHTQIKHAMLAFLILFIMSALLGVVGWPGNPPALFWA
ncbi:MAG: hypothetical protein ACOYKA_01175 [Legionellaceae bacterium]